jgi:hypothetical protein
MKPLFTIHAGEYVVGEFIERNFPSLNIWIPSKDTGIDLLVTSAENSKSVSLQVKLSKDYKKSVAKSKFDEELSAAGWFTLKHDKIAKSEADLWVFVLVCHERKAKTHYILISPHDLLRHLESVCHLKSACEKSDSYHFYPSILKDGRVLNSRGMSATEKRALFKENLELGDRDLRCLDDNWKSLKAMEDFQPKK